MQECDVVRVHIISNPLNLIYVIYDFIKDFFLLHNYLGMDAKTGPRPNERRRFAALFQTCEFLFTSLICFFHQFRSGVVLSQLVAKNNKKHLLNRIEIKRMSVLFQSQKDMCKKYLFF